MASNQQPQTQMLWIIIAAACLVFGSVFGSVLGYALATAGRPAAPTAAAAPIASQPVAPPATAPAVSGGVDEKQLQAYRDVLRLDPGNLEAATQAANLLYDAGRYAEAVPLYRQAFALDPTNVSVSTDLGTALWYGGQADEALAQYAKSLTIDPSHAQTLFNVGLVKLDGKKDPRGAIEAWEKLLKTNPNYENTAKVRDLIARAR